MPIEKPTKQTAPVHYPKSNYQVVKYLDITKFISLLQRQALFFCRVDYLEDHFEGTVPKANFQNRVRFIEAFHDFSPNGPIALTDDELEKHVKELYEANEKMKSVTCVSCWNISDKESAALWKIYSDFDKGLMITSKISGIIQALEEISEDIQMSEIKYIDYENDEIPDGNHNFPLIHKHVAYSYEKELRLLHFVEYGPGFKYDWTSEEISAGKYISVNLDKLIDEIVISPHAPEWYFHLIKDLLEKYGLGHKTILKSELSKE